MFLDFQQKKWKYRDQHIGEKTIHGKKTGQHYQEGERIITGISKLQQIRNLLDIILLISNPEHWRK